MASNPAMVTLLVEAHLVPHVQDFLGLARKMVPSSGTMRDESGLAADVFHHDGDVWQIRHVGASSVVPHLVGMGYIASLLAAPAVHFNCQELDQSIHDAGVYEPVVDREALKAYTSQIVELDTAEADGRLTQELARQRDQLESEIRRVRGLGGRLRPAVGAKELSRIRVSKAIERAMRSIEKRNPRLGAHLRQTIRRGGMLVYLPESPIQWEL